MDKGFVLDSTTFECGQAQFYVRDTSGVPNVAYTAYPKGKPWHQARDTTLTVKSFGIFTFKQRTKNGFCTEYTTRQDSIYIADTLRTGYTIGCVPFQAVIRNTGYFDTLHSHTQTWYLTQAGGGTDTFKGSLDTFSLNVQKVTYAGLSLKKEKGCTPAGAFTRPQAHSRQAKGFILCHAAYGLLGEDEP